jgi:hypothetical protein
MIHAVTSTSFIDFPFSITEGTFSDNFPTGFIFQRPLITFDVALRTPIKAIDFNISFPFQVFARSPSFP